MVIKDEWTTDDGSIRLLLGDCLEILPVRKRARWRERATRNSKR